MAIEEMIEIESTAASLRIDLDMCDFNSVELPTGENCGIFSDDEDVYLYDDDQRETDSGFESVIIVDNLPIVSPEKFEKLEGVIRRIFSQFGVIKEDGIWMPIDPETNKTLGFCFIEFNTPQEAELAKKRRHGFKLDRAHTLAVIMFDDFDKFMGVTNEWSPPEIKSYKHEKNLLQWLTDEKARDQFLIRAATDTEVLWNDARQSKSELVYKRPHWTDSFVQWSPLGTYLATVHMEGAKIWGGPSSFDPLMRYDHPQFKLIDFSPGEKYLVTYSSHEPSNRSDANRVVIKIFDVRTGQMKRDFERSADEFAIAGVSWPVFRWGGGREDKYFAKLGKNIISVYETETFGLVDGRHLEVENVVDFIWSPTDPIIALFVPEMGGGNQPARVTLIQIPSKEEVRRKNLFNVSDCKMYWQSNGDYLAVKVDRYTKTKNTYTGFELFRIKERDISIEVLELDNKKDKIIDFAWEPNGHSFAIIHGDNPRPDISFYSMQTAKNVGRVSKLTTLKGKQANKLFWSPGGRFIVLAGLKGFNGQLEFFDVDELQTMSTAEHFMATDIEWDPTGRYVATSVTSVHEMENGFNIWSFNGKLLYRVMKDHFFQFLWRPRPPSVLTREKEEEIAMNLKKYSQKYECEDQDVSTLLSDQDRERRRMLKEEWINWVSEWRLAYMEEKSEREELIGEVSDEEEDEYEVEVEEVLNVSEELFRMDLGK
ncbi:hypothetical protein COLO4_30887 [Corchorus olitorius]|uniref:Eukaryotic translation initiation factor 3 subunit B n=1 Tax=Corchorus olitorius TaxID=93759 RepID=A0A1R3H6I9_9ROSI|nr:hypothetical protein COLO4_30887 [Corchorus olitorius]